MSADILETKRIMTCRNAVKTAESIAAVKPGIQINPKLREALEDAETSAPRFLERDHMPLQVATELLCAPRISNLMRKKCNRAREKHFVSVSGNIPFEYKQASRFSRADIAQIGKWLRRAIVLLKRTERDFDRPALKKISAAHQKIAVTIFEHRQSSLEKTIEVLKQEVFNRTMKKI